VIQNQIGEALGGWKAKLAAPQGSWQQSPGSMDDRTYSSFPRRRCLLREGLVRVLRTGQGMNGSPAGGSRIGSTRRGVGAKHSQRADVGERAARLSRSAQWRRPVAAGVCRVKGASKRSSVASSWRKRRGSAISATTSRLHQVAIAQ
jgi:hypothetical protein